MDEIVSKEFGMVDVVVEKFVVMLFDDWIIVNLLLGFYGGIVFGNC